MFKLFIELWLQLRQTGCFHGLQVKNRLRPEVETQSNLHLLILCIMDNSTVCNHCSTCPSNGRAETRCLLCRVIFYIDQKQTFEIPWVTMTSPSICSSLSTVQRYEVIPLQKLRGLSRDFNTTSGPYEYDYKATALSFGR